MSERISVVPDTGGSEVKLSFKSLWSFLSSLDYLRFLELEGAFRHINSSNLYYQEEKTELMMFVVRHVVLWINVAYFVIILSGYFIFRDKFLILHLSFSVLYFLAGMWIVHRYTVGRGYLYMLVRDFLFWTTAFVLLTWIVSEFLSFWLVPKLWKMFEAWLFDPSSQQGTINKLLYPVCYEVYSLIKPHIYDLFGTKKFIMWYFALAPVKVFSIGFPYAYFLIYSKTRKSTREALDTMFRKRA